MTALNVPSDRTLIDELLAEQKRLTAVERFAQKHDRGQMPAHGRLYRDLIPLTKPALGQQYAFAVDLDACTGCKACVSACHSLNGLDEDEIWRNVGLIHGGSPERPYQQTVTAACHHCVEPACLEGCPVMAYEKDEETGIVRHLDDQCIGCQYCVLKCPYDVPKYSKKKGIVRKCDMCSSRLVAGEAPACVQACPTHAIRIELVDKEEVSRAAKPDSTVIPGAFPSDYTQPTTRYRTRRSMPADTRPGDASQLRLEHAHWPLVFMLVLTQASVGLYGATALFPHAARSLSAAGFVLLNVGLAVSLLHLGRPLGAWRFFLGLRTSWMSREILAFSALAGAAAACTVGCWWEALAAIVPGARLVEDFIAPARWAAPLATLTTLLGLAGVYCSAMIYVDTRRAFWVRELTFPKFFGTTALLGAAGASSLLAWGGWPGTQAALMGSLILHAALLGWEWRSIHSAFKDPADAIHGPAVVMWRLQRPLMLARVALFLVAGCLALVAVSTATPAIPLLATFVFLAIIAAQTVERTLFFTAAVAPKMPGGVAP